MGTRDNNEGTKPDTVHKRAKAWDGFLGSDAEFISSNTQSAKAGNNVRFDGSTEQNGGATGKEVKERIASCREAYENVGIIGNIVDLMVDFASEGIDIYHRSGPVQKFFRQWATKVNLSQLSQQILKSIYRDGNVPVLSYWGEISEKEVKTFKKAVGKNHSNLFMSDEIVDGSKIIPYKFQVLDVLSLDRTGSEMLGTAGWSYQFDTADYEVLSSDMDAKTREVVKHLKDSLGTAEFNKLKGTGQMTLDPARFDMLYYKKDGYKSWANPMLWRVMNDVKYKKLLRDMDISLAEGVTNALTVVKLGATKDGLPPSKKKYQKIVSMLKNPSKAKTIVWDDLIDIQTVYPPIESLLSSEKYKQVDDDIRSGLGIAEILINGGGGNYSSSFLSVKTLLERLELGRQMLLEYLENQVRLVSKSMGFRTAPVIRMNHMSLADQDSEKKFMLELFDRNAISFETLTERFGESFDIELERVKGEDKKREKIKDDSPFGLLRVGKFGPQYPAGPPELQELASGPVPQEENMVNLPSTQEDNGKKGGRKSGEPQKRRSGDAPAAPVGQSNASLFTSSQVDEAFDVTYKAVAASVCKEMGYADARSFNGEDMEKVLSEVVNALPEILIAVAHTGDDADNEKASVKSVEMASSLINASLVNFVEETGKKPGKQKTKEIVKKAFNNSIGN